MTALASRSPYPAPTLSGNTYRQPAPTNAMNGHNVFTSPTDSEFSESYTDGRESVVDWDEVRVAEWLKSINCSQYVEIFRKNNITGENLMDIDQATLKEMGVKKIGDRVRIGSQAKVFRSNVYKRTSKRVVNRHSLAMLDGNALIGSTQVTPPSSGSPRPLHSARSGTTSRADKRISRQLNGTDMAYAAQFGSKTSSRPSSPMVDQENRATRTQRQGAPSPLEASRSQNSAAYLAQPQAARFAGKPNSVETPQTARFHVKQSPSLDNLNPAVSGLPADKPLIRVIYENGRYSVISIEGFRTAEDIVRVTLRKGGLNENHSRSYCFYILDGTDPKPAFCRRLGEAELIKLCNDGVRTERGRLILRKIHAGEPDGEQLRSAARIAEQQQPEPPAIEVQQPIKSKSHLKIEKLTGEPLAAVSYPMSPASRQERKEYFQTQSDGIQRNVSTASTASARARKLKDFYGARPPTELITQDLQSYFPEVAKDDMDRTVRMSIRRSKRLSRAVRTLSMASNFSVASSLKDAPPLPTIADSWLREAGMQKSQPGLRPLSVVRLGRSDSHRESIASSVLEPLDEESPLEPNRKSYVSFGGDSGSDTTTSNLAITDPEGQTVLHSYFDDTGTSPAATEGGSDSLNSRLSRFIAEDGDELDEELMQHLENDSWDNLKYMKGAMIGQGSFGTVFLALHAVTAELMAVKQVEMPSNSGTTMDAKKNNMIEALKHEISLLKDLKHENIVQYLGSNSDEKNLNIFLEYVAGGSVATMLVNYGSLPEGLIANFVRQILQGLNYLHSKDIIHRDIKGANILVDNKGTVKISDFGISKRVEASTLLNPQPGPRRGGPRVSLQGSVFWMAPEVVRQTAYTKKADIWSLGCLIVEMFTGSHPHPNCTQLQAIFKIGGSGSNADNARPAMPDQASEDAKEFLRRTFEIEHEKRPSAEELIGSNFAQTKA
ncbi:Mitogen-activated protein kinase kinae kinase MST11 [Fulvia fulva]|uniref:mitogen-activated protein kinase kinase kinase n=1 Tax=Passalora fulva TaxID=5499 RepID=A0A9Q8L533_PASFU|nr:Mitogen-activated protein kinase kinae kinase MST11 [Fulvia fulva]KAK4636232.1 Mitogen-activated protein kinase kinae kinase MST11 [Fulvia fulva]KAK4637798.1 Mitogen-activated protein kinase kinae kinase MST11 [Fulvia fulva]UJO11016.1 Mitogen-activated protein kinase kinae kinase MST11 [Fulvia fulva]WPV08273.1 Mitogen-activated protein kinase kinae kinase MST11 [Fulvia fulva]WPV25222.1 Mitogen-activated protein kinase kinae kinase MST11 [Fulvia fulva]